MYGYPIYHCAGCGVGFVWPQPTDNLLRRFYDETMRNYIGDMSCVYQRPLLREHMIRREAEFVDRVLQHRLSSRVLDVGTGDGSLPRMLTDLGYRHVRGFDWDSGSVRRARETLGVDVVCGDFLSFDEGNWDAITFFASIEHFRDPLRQLSHARQLLSQDGVVVVMTGDNDSFLARLQGCFDMWMTPPEHLFFFHQRSLLEALVRSGFRETRCRLGFQNPIKERVLLLFRIQKALGSMLHKETRPRWRSVNSNLLVAWGRIDPGWKGTFSVEGTSGAEPQKNQEPVGAEFHRPVGAG